MAKKTKASNDNKPKKARKPREKKADPKQPALQVAGANSIDRDRQALAIVHRDNLIRKKASVSKANREMAALKKLIKQDGFTVKQIQVMADLQTPEGEAAVKLSVMQTLEAARWQGPPIGAQLELFQEPDRTPSVDVAKEQGIRDAMEGKAAVPPYDPSVPQHAAYMDGFHAENERRIKAGITKPDADEKSARAAALAAAREANQTAH